jgi:hypothetical protein
VKHLLRSWNSLGDVKRYLETHTKEKILSFNGFELVTNKGTYGLALKQLRFTTND